MKNKLSYLVLVFILVLLPACSAAQDKNLEINLIVQGLNPVVETEVYEGYEINYTVFTDYSFEFYDAFVNSNSDNFEENAVGDFRVDLLDYNNMEISSKFFDLGFMILSDPPVETDVEITSLSFPYTGREKILRIYDVKTGKLYLNYDLGNALCNNDGACDERENYYSCFSDCNWYSDDGLCLGMSGDKFCEKDCYDDSDCNLPNCNDGIKNQDEVLTDIGGVCNGNCFDGFKNGNEAGIDCGGSCSLSCLMDIHIDPDAQDTPVTEASDNQIKLILDSWINNEFNLKSTLTKIKEAFEKN